MDLKENELMKKSIITQTFFPKLKVSENAVNMG